MLFSVESNTTSSTSCVAPGIGGSFLGLVVGGVAGAVISFVVMWAFGRRKEARIHDDPKKSTIADASVNLDTKQSHGIGECSDL